MTTYVHLCKLTREGKMDIKKAPERLANARKVMEESGGKIVAFYPVFGRYDYIVVTEAPDDESTMKAVMAITMAGAVEIETLRVLPLEKFQETIKKLP